MKPRQTLICADLEGVFTPEVWIAVAEKTGIERLRLTTRDVPDYDVLMKGRLQILREHGLRLDDIQAVIRTLDPLPGAREFLDWVRARTQIIILSDTYTEFAAPLMAKLGYPTLFCNSLTVDENRMIVDYNIRIRDGKKHAVKALKGLNYRVIAMGDSYNDTTMLAEADVGILFRPPANVVAEFPQFRVTREYEELKAYLEELL
ncbi:MAG: bifunctional phosphoserine phosphatase/homoserine phosphotransferase ThrH [Candidatus Sumerlaeia bacterium]|nr:bifunctional phosphoserine phosphatase/homoserine phosphotransferase ThrH [Candidatus Sumerlaeia bacterium]